jgi:hypothetical protein
MSILLCVLIAWVTFSFLFVGLGLLILEHFSSTPKVTIADESVSEHRGLRSQSLSAMDESVQKARELASAFEALAQLEGAAALAPRDAIPTSASAVADPAQRRDAVIIRDSRLTRARTLGDQSGGRLNATFVFPTVFDGRDTAA